MGLRRSIGSPLALSTVLALCGCKDEQQNGFSGDVRQDFPLAGLHTPGSRIGAAEVDNSMALVDAGSGLSAEEQAAVEAAIQEGMGERCEAVESDSGSGGKLNIQFQSETYGGFYEPENCGAVWIEDTDGQYVATPMIWAQLRTRNLFIWDARRCKVGVPDVVSSATLPDHGKMHHAVWDGTNYLDVVVPDGTYFLNIEITEDEFNYGRRGQYPFENFGPTNVYTPPDQESIIGLVMTFTPNDE